MKRGDIGICIECGKEFIAANPKQIRHKECNEVMKLRKKEEVQYSRYTIFARDDFKCVYCGKSSIEHGAYLVLDHIVPYIDSKDSSIYNLITACFHCNGVKGPSRLSKDVYERIIRRNIERNKGISPSKQREVEITLTE